MVGPDQVLAVVDEEAPRPIGRSADDRDRKRAWPEASSGVAWRG